MRTRYSFLNLVYYSIGILALMSSALKVCMYRRIKARRRMVTACTCTVHSVLHTSTCMYIQVRWRQLAVTPCENLSNEYIVISSEKNWRLQLDVSISMLWSSSGNVQIHIHVYSMHIWIRALCTVRWSWDSSAGQNYATKPFRRTLIKAM